MALLLCYYIKALFPVASVAPVATVVFVLDYQPQANSVFLSEQINYQQSTFFSSQQISITYPPNEQAATRAQLPLRVSPGRETSRIRRGLEDTARQPHRDPCFRDSDGVGETDGSSRRCRRALPATPRTPGRRT